MTKPHNNTVAIRVAKSDEAPVVRRLAALDDARPLDGDVLLALVDDEAVAAVSLGDGRVVANPFLHTADTVRLLSMRAAQLAAPAASSQRAWIPRLRAA